MLSLSGNHRRSLRVMEILRRGEGNHLGAVRGRALPEKKTQETHSLWRSGAAPSVVPGPQKEPVKLQQRQCERQAESLRDTIKDSSLLWFQLVVLPKFEFYIYLIKIFMQPFYPVRVHKEAKKKKI